MNIATVNNAIRFALTITRLLLLIITGRRILVYVSAYIVG